MMADSDAATALKLNTRMDIILWDFGPREETKEETKTPSQTKEKDAIIDNMAKHLDEEKRRKYSRPYVLACNAREEGLMAKFGTILQW